MNKVSSGFHAIPAENSNPLKTLPAMHRLFNVLGMVAGFNGVKYIGDIMYGHRINGGHHEEILKENVPSILRPLHGIIKSNPHSDEKRDKELTIVHKMLPAVGGATGAIMGSAYFFEQNGTNQKFKDLVKKSASKGLTAAEQAAVDSYAKGKTWRLAAGLTAWPSSASGLTGLLYGTSLNTAFWLGNNSKKAPPAPTRSRIMWAAGEMGAVIAGLGLFAHYISRKRERAASDVDINEDVSKISAQQYVDAVGKKRDEKEEKGLLNGKVLKVADWMADSALAVIPVHRFWSAIGLTAGGTLGLAAGKLLTGKGLAGGAGFKEASLPKPLQSLNGIMAPNPEYSDAKNKLLTAAGKYVFAAFCAVGVMIGSKHAYKSTYLRNSNPDSLEDYVARVRQHHGDRMIPFIASSSIFGSAAGTYLVPIIPGINYGSSLAYRVVSMQDRNITSPGLDVLTGNTTYSYFGVREGLQYLRKYAEHNPSQRPEQFEYYAYTVMGPLAKAAGVELTGEHIKKFVDKLNGVRDKYWQEGGVPKDKQEDLAKDLKEHFTGRGLDKTLYECGIDTMQIDFQQIGGLIGRFARLMGTGKKVAQEQKDYRDMVQMWREDWGKETDKPANHHSDVKKPDDKAPSANPALTMSQDVIDANAAELEKQFEHKSSPAAEKKPNQEGTSKVSHEKASYTQRYAKQEAPEHDETSITFEGPVSVQAGASNMPEAGSPLHTVTESYAKTSRA
ncbi:MAG TPA: hypothetical protein VFT64_07755 [Rickettsiales bacterium]|nr:hypothetical protein [Rickettsiales bacterium]